MVFLRPVAFPFYRRFAVLRFWKLPLSTYYVNRCRFVAATATRVFFLGRSWYSTRLALPGPFSANIGTTNLCFNSLKSSALKSPIVCARWTRWFLKNFEREIKWNVAKSRRAEFCVLSEIDYQLSSYIEVYGWKERQMIKNHCESIKLPWKITNQSAWPFWPPLWRTALKKKDTDDSEKWKCKKWKKILLKII